MRLIDCYLGEADLTGANLQGASFFLTNLTGADLTGANVDDVDFAQARGLNLEGTIGTPFRMP